MKIESLGGQSCPLVIHMDHCSYLISKLVFEYLAIHSICTQRKCVEILALCLPWAVMA